MATLIEKEKVKAKLRKLREELYDHNLYFEEDSGMSAGYDFALDDISNFVDSLPEYTLSIPDGGENQPVV